MQTVGERIKEQRQKKNYTQADLSKAVDVTTQTVINWEKNKRIIDAQKLIAVAEKLETSASYLTGETDDPRPIAKKSHAISSESTDSSEDKTMNMSVFTAETIVEDPVEFGAYIKSLIHKYEDRGEELEIEVRRRVMRDERRKTRTEKKDESVS